MTQDIRWWHIIALVIIITGVSLTIWTAQQQDQQLRTELLTKAKIATENIDPEILAALTGSPSDITTPEYRHLKTKLARIRTVDPSLRFTYLMGQRPDGIFIYVDSEPVDSADYSPPGQLYTEVAPRVVTVFSDKEPITEGPYTDRWGTWVSAVVPVTDPKTGRLVALFGMDVDARYWDYDIAKACATIITAFLLLLVLVVSFGLMQQRQNRREQQRLAASDDKFYRAFHTNPALMAVSSIEEGRFLEVNASFLKILGYSQDEVIGKMQSELGLYSDPAQWDFIRNQIKESGHVRDIDVNLLKKNHDVLTGSFSAITIDVAGLPCQLTVILDITERKQAENAIRESEVRFRTIIHSMQFGIIIIDAHAHTILDANDKALEMIGGTNDIIIGSVCHQFICPAELGRCPVTDLGQSVDSSERVLLNLRGEKIPILKSVIRTSLGGREVLIESFIDITERKKAEEALRESDERFSVLLQHVPSVAVQGYSMDGTTQYWNEASEHFYGYTAKEAIGKNLLDLVIPPEMQEEFRKAMTNMAETGQPIPASELSLMRKDGSRVAVFSSHAMVKKAGGGIELFCIDIDLTERKLAEDTLLRINQKLNVLSQLTRQDLTTQIFVLNSFLEMAKKQAIGQDGIIKNIESGERAVRSIKEITEFTKDYQNMGEKPPKYQNVKLAILFGLSHISIGEIQHSLETENLEIFADPLLEKAFQGLLENTVAHGGHVSKISVSHRVILNGVTIVFEDDGTGIPQKDKEQIFLRSKGARTSVRGLFFVREILDITGITIKETGEPGKGARFEMTVPKGAWRIGGR